MTTAPGFLAATVQHALTSLSQLTALTITTAYVGLIVALFLVNSLHSWNRLSHIPRPE
jgi:hypothetical protein